MEKLLLIMERFAPDALTIISTRYRLLRQVYYNEPIGRRQLCRELNLTERAVRGEIDFLKKRGAVNVTSAGIIITSSGKDLLYEMSDIVPALFNLQSMAESLKSKFKLKQAIVVPGNSSVDLQTKKDMGRAAARCLSSILEADSILAVTGGTTLAEMAGVMNGMVKREDVLVVPARGGLGEDVEQQANIIAARIAGCIGASYRLLHIPDNLDETTVEVLKNDLHIKQVLQMVKKSSILVHGIGSAMEMAARRGLSDREISLLEEKNAVGEAFRYYYDESGNIVYEVPGIGLELADLMNIKTVIAVAGGRNKAAAIKAVLLHGQLDILVTDEGAAEGIISLMN